ncbi:unnamed protein product [Sphagnum jensenii]|uniref:Secreted protein n=1 Tax=Sphagnum jensenii TaxID=128206 RepID=A0ABP1BVR8_9BRYO
MEVLTGNSRAPLPTDMILVLAALMRMASCTTQKSTILSIVTNLSTFVLNRTMSSAYSSVAMVVRDKGSEPGLYTN